MLALVVCELIVVLICRAAILEIAVALIRALGLGPAPLLIENKCEEHSPNKGSCGIQTAETNAHSKLSSFVHFLGIGIAASRRADKATSKALLTPKQLNHQENERFNIRKKHGSVIAQKKPRKNNVQTSGITNIQGEWVQERKGDYSLDNKPRVNDTPISASEAPNSSAPLCASEARTPTETSSLCVGSIFGIVEYCLSPICAIKLLHIAITIGSEEHGAVGCVGRPQRVQRESDSRLVTRVPTQKEVQFRLASDSTRDDSEHPRAMARGQSAGHEGMVGVMVEGWWGWGWKDSGGGGGWWWWWWWSTPNDSSSRPSRIIRLIASHPPPHRIIIVSSSSSSSSSSIVGTAIHDWIVCCPFAGLTRPIDADSKSSVGHVGADLKSSADSVVADLKSSNECPSRAPALLLAQSQQQQARHKAEAKDTPHRLPDNRQSSEGDNRRSPGGRGGGKRYRDITRSDAYASLRDSARVAGSGEIVVYSSFEPRKVSRAILRLATGLVTT
ncbi:hypothetical protein BDZ89DRAFT_1195958 [Hymenopellis radicata]|nr:hypothetical protein BDZ89DRAFT_1195958 [Hymenopellis radicata]